MHYYLYQVTNLVNKKIYVGVHKTKNIADGYMGSGRVIKAAIAKYGLCAFQKDILETFKTSTAMYAKEREIVTEGFLAREDVYNVRRGGTGGFDWINKNTSTEERMSRGKEIYLQTNGLTRALKNLKRINRLLKNSAWKENRSKKSIAARILKYGHLNHFAGKSHTEETKNLISASAKVTSSGKRNSQYGTVWITNGFESKKMKKGEPIPKGWVRGR